MFTASRYGLLYYVFILLNVKTCLSELLPPAPPSLALYSPGEAEHAPVLVRREQEPLTLVCELRGAPPPRRYVWNYLPDGDDAVHEPLRAEPAPATAGAAGSSTLRRARLRPADSGQYICSAPPFSARKYVLVQPPGEGLQCARGALSCGTRCVLAGYVCDGHADCAAGEDEALGLCGARPCAAPDRLNCSSGRCIPSAACCRAPAPLCRQPRCCDHHPAHWRPDGYAEVDFPPLFEDRHAPDDYSFIQSTIYTVTACALIFMIAVVLLVSAICKLHMKRAALRSRPPPAARFPPRYEAARPTEPPIDPQRLLPVPFVPQPEPAPRGLARLAGVFRPRYTAVPSQCGEVELQPLGPPAGGAPPRPRSLALGRLLARRPDTPTVPPPGPPADAAAGDFARLSHETYTLNGRTIRLLGGEFESYPPPYNKLYGPPPRYPSGGSLGGSTGSEPPPRYEDLGDDVTSGEGNTTNSAGLEIENNGIGNVIDYDSGASSAYGFSHVAASNNVGNVINFAATITDTGNVINDNDIAEANRNVNDYSVDNAAYGGISNVMDCELLAANNDTAYSDVSANTVPRTGDTNTGISKTVSECNGNISLSAVIDNLPAIDSDVNANDTIADACAVMFSNGIVAAGNGN